MAETVSNGSLGEALTNLIQVLSNKPDMAGKSVEEIKRVAEEQMRKRLEARAADVKKRADERIARRAKDWADTIKNEETQKEALAQLEREKYPDGLTLTAAREHVADTEAIVNAKQPEWLNTSIHECPQAVELIARVTQLSPELQNDPNVLCLELARLNKSMRWSEATAGARHEARVVQDKMLARIAEVAKNDAAFGSAQRDALLETIDPARIHLKTVAEIKSAGEEPDKSHKKEHEEWVDKKVAEEQAKNLKDVIDSYQGYLDLPVNASAENQREQLDQLLKELRTGNTRKQQLSGVEGDYAGFNRADATSYIESAQTRVNKLDPIVEQTRQSQRGMQDIKRSVESGRAIQWNEKLRDIYKHKEHQDGEVLEIGYRLTQEDVEDIVYGGIPGQRRWLARFRERWVGATGEPFKSNLEAEMQFHEFIKIADWLNGREHAALTLQYRDLWSLYEDIDSVVKGTLYRPKGQKSEESFNILRYLTPTHHDILRKYDMVDIAKPAVSEAIEDVMRDELFLYQQRLDKLQEIVTYDNKKMRRVDKFIVLRDKYNHQKEYKDMLKLREKGTDPKRLQELEKKFIGKSTQYGGLSQELFDEMTEIETMVDEIGRGVLLRDYHMLAHVEPYNGLLEGHKEYKDILWDLSSDNTNKLSSVERKVKEDRRDQLLSEMQQHWKEFTRNTTATFNPNTDGELLMELRNFSPVEIRARDRVVQTLRNDWIHDHNGSLEGFDKYLKNNSYKIRDAVWAARTIVVGTGEAMEKGAKLGRSAMFDLQFTLGLPKELKTKHFMDRGFAEAYQRVLNPYIFEEDFHMGGPMGEVARNLNYEAAFNEVGYDYKKDLSMPKEWKNKIKLAEQGKLFANNNLEAPIPVWVVYTEYAQEVMGMSFTEALRPDLLATGIQQLSTYWRMQRVALEPIIADYLKTKTSGESPEFQALGIQLASLSETNTAGRMQVMRRMLERKPSIFIKLLGKDLDGILQSENLQPGTLEWRNFRDTLALMEMELWRNPQYANKPFDLTQKDSFISLSRSAIAAVNPSLTPQAIISRSETYFNIIDKVQSYMTAHGVNGKTRLENWANHKFANLLLLSSSDFDWQKTNFAQLDLYGIERRINDFQGQKRAEEHRRDVLTKSELLSPLQGKEADTLAKIKEFRDEIINYAGQETAEIAQAALMRTVIEFNRNRAIHTPAGWIPGAVSLMKRANVMNENLEVTVENMPKFIREPIQHFLDKTKLAGKPINKWPRSISEAVSLAVGFGGPEANAWDEYRIGGFLAGAETSMMFVKYPEKLARMRNRFKTTILWRSLGVVRKYWWVVPLATVVVALSDEMEEEKKGRR